MAELQITIDDGPQPVASALNPILEELKRRKVVAAFFVLGSEVKASPAAAKDILSQGHVLANHSWDHLMPSTDRFTDEQVLDQFRRTHEEVKRVTQTSMRHWRAPRLQQISRLTGLLVKGANPLYTLSHCDVHADSKDSQGANDASAMLRALRADISRDAGRRVFRLLFHVKSQTATAFRAVLDGLVTDGHKLVAFSQTA